MRENKMKKIRIAAAGDNCMDVYDKENKAFPGGNPVNVAVYVARLGGASAYIGPVGTDAYGKQMMDAIQGKGVDVSRMKILEGTTAVTHVEIVDGDRVLGDYASWRISSWMRKILIFSVVMIWLFPVSGA